MGFLGTIPSRGIKWAAVAVAIAAILVVGLNLLENGSGQAYAEAVQRIRNATTMTFVETTTNPTNTPVTFHERTGSSCMLHLQKADRQNRILAFLYIR